MKYTKLLLPMMFLALCISCSLFNREGRSIDMKLRPHAAAQRQMIFNGDTLVFRLYNPNPAHFFDPPPFQSKVNNHQIVITGYFLAGYSRIMPEATITSDGKQITVHVYMPPFPYKISLDMAAPYIYDLYLSDIPDGEYTVTILHSDDTMRPSFDKYRVFKKDFIIGGEKTE